MPHPIHHKVDTHRKTVLDLESPNSFKTEPLSEVRRDPEGEGPILVVLLALGYDTKPAISSFRDGSHQFRS
jgi:hypothetical protein